MQEYTHRTKDGRPARILCRDFKNLSYPVLVAVLNSEGLECVSLYTSDLKAMRGRFHQHDLEEYSPWADVAVDTPIWVRDYPEQKWIPRHFSNFSGGKVSTWGDGYTSHTARGVGRHTDLTKEWEYATLDKANDIHDI